MTRTTRSAIVAFGCSLALLSVASPRLRAAAGAGRAPVLERYGDITVRDLPRATPRLDVRPAPPFRPVDPDSFKRRKSSPQTAEAPHVSTSASPSTVVVTDAGFDGVSFAEAGTLPPDTQVAVGPDHIFEAVNGAVRIWGRQVSPPAVVYNVDLGSFFGVGLFNYVISDPRVVYDPTSDRWFVSCVTIDLDLATFSYVGAWRLAVSKTNDPTGTYTLYAASFTNDTFPDFPSLGVSDDKVALTGNAFTISAEQFVGSEFEVIKKADVVAAVSRPAYTFFGPPQAVDSIQAAQSLSPTSTLFLAAVPGDGQSSTLQIWSIDGVPGVGGGVTVASTAVTQLTTLVIPPEAVQPNSPIAVATNDARLLNVAYRNGSLWMGGATGCMPAGDTAMRACLHFVEVNAATKAVVQEITFGELGLYYFFPAVTTDAAGNMITVFNRSSSSEYVSLYASGHNASDAIGAFDAPLLVHAGLGAYDPTPYAPRWGDYSGIAVDPFDAGATVWVAGEYEPVQGGLNWGTWIAKLSSGSTTCTPPATPIGLGAAAGDAQVTLSWSASSGASAYNVKRAAASGGPYGMVANPTAATYTDIGLANGSTFYYVVSAVNTCGESADSAEVSATPTAVQLPAAPTKLNAVGAKRKVMLSWTQSTSAGVTQNNVYRSTTSGGPYTNIASIGARTSYTDTQVTGGTTYYYVVTAITSSGESAPSNQASAKPK